MENAPEDQDTEGREVTADQEGGQSDVLALKAPILTQHSREGLVMGTPCHMPEKHKVETPGDEAR